MASLCRHSIWAGCALWLWLALAGSASVASDSLWSIRAWRADEGLPDSRLSGVALAADGRLWVATQHGLSRFDGLSFRAVPLPAIPGSPRQLIRTLHSARAGRLWLALEGGAVLGLGLGSTNVFTAEEGVPTARPVAIAETADGAVWVSYVDGSAVRFQAGRVQRFTSRDGLAGVGSCSLATDAQGRLWFGKAGRVGVFGDGRFETLATFEDRVTRVTAAAGGGVWVYSGGCLRRVEPGREPRLAGQFEDALAEIEPTVMLADRTGNVWLGSLASGLFRWDGQELRRAPTTHGEIRGLAEDQEGNLWVATGGGGLNRLGPRVLEMEGVEDGLPFETVRSVCEDRDGVMWAAAQNGGLARLHQGRWETVSDRARWPSITCVVGDPQGGVWLGTLRDGLHHWHGEKLAALGHAPGVAGGTIRALAVDSRGALWIGLEGGSCVERLENDKWLALPLPAGIRAVRAMAEGADGSLWLGTTDGHLLRVERETVVDETPRLFAAPRPIRCLHATPDGSLWIGFAGAGLGRWRGGRFSVVGPTQGLRDDSVSQVLADGLGSLWLAGNQGLFRVRESEVNDVAEGRASAVWPVPFGRNEGHPNLQGSFGYEPGSWHSRDGRLWMPMRTGLAVVHPGRAKTTLRPPPALIEAVAVDGRLLELVGDAAVPVAPGHRRIEFEFTAPGLSAPENVRFRHRLAGWDVDWVEAGRERHAGYGRLPAGDYRFEVTACNESGQWNDRPAVATFRVTLTVWERWWFRLALLGAFTAALVGAVRYVSFRRLRTRLRSLEQQTALHRERTRIAKDIHDDLGASLTQIALLGELAQDDLAAPAKAQEHITRIASTARQSVKSLEEIVWAVNPRNDTLAHLLNYVGQFAVDFLSTTPIRCRVDFPAEPPAREVSAEVRHSLFLVVKEALHNIVKHSGASEVWLRVALAEREWEFEITDNGCGFTGAPGDAWADGLRNMRQRLSELGGACDIQSQPGNGTRIRLLLPWSPKGGA